MSRPNAGEKHESLCNRRARLPRPARESEQQMLARPYHIHIFSTYTGVTYPCSGCKLPYASVYHKFAYDIYPGCWRLWIPNGAWVTTLMSCAPEEEEEETGPRTSQDSQRTFCPPGSDSDTETEIETETHSITEENEEATRQAQGTTSPRRRAVPVSLTPWLACTNPLFELDEVRRFKSSDQTTIMVDWDKDIFAMDVERIVHE